MGNFEKLLRSDETFRYQMLSRLQQDCEYYLGNGNRHNKSLWAENEEDHIEAMKVLWNSFEEEDKPEWLTWEDILSFESEMIG